MKKFCIKLHFFVTVNDSVIYTLITKKTGIYESLKMVQKVCLEDKIAIVCYKQICFFFLLPIKKQSKQ